MDKPLQDFRQEDCPICIAPEKATWRERFDHGCSLPGEVKQCVWCGEPHEEGDGPKGSTVWCGPSERFPQGCSAAHKAANPEAWWFKGWVDIADTLPGGPHDGVWENSGLSLGGNTLRYKPLEGSPE